MADKSGITERLITGQMAMFRIAATRGFSQELIHAETGLSTTSLSEWATGKTKISMVAVRALAETDGFPCDLLSLLFPSGKAVVHVPTGIDHDEVERACRDFLSAKGEAHHPESPAGRDIAQCEDQTLACKVLHLRGKIAA